MGPLGPLTPIILRLFDSQGLTQLALFELPIAAAGLEFLPPHPDPPPQPTRLLVISARCAWLGPERFPKRQSVMSHWRKQIF